MRRVLWQTFQNNNYSKQFFITVIWLSNSAFRHNPCCRIIISVIVALLYWIRHQYTYSLLASFNLPRSAWSLYLYKLVLFSPVAKSHNPLSPDFPQNMFLLLLSFAIFPNLIVLRHENEKGQSTAWTQQRLRMEKKGVAQWHWEWRVGDGQSITQALLLVMAKEYIKPPMTPAKLMSELV